MPTVPSLDDYRLAHERVLESLWLAAVDLDLPFSAYVAQVAEPMWLISYTDLIHRPEPTEHVFACWIESEAHHLAVAEAQRDELARFCDVCGFTWPPDERCPFH